MQNSFTRRAWRTVFLAAVLVCAGDQVARAQQETRCFVLEFFYDSQADDAAELRQTLNEFADERTGLKVRFSDVKEEGDADRQRLDQIAKAFGLSEVKLPAVYGLRCILADLKNEADLRRRLDQTLTLTAYVREGCPHCRDAKAFLRKCTARYPALKFVYRDVIADRAAAADMEKVTNHYRRQAASLPVVHFCNGLTIGFDRESTTGRRMLQTLDYWSTSCPVKKKQN